MRSRGGCLARLFVANSAIAGSNLYKHIYINRLYICIDIGVSPVSGVSPYMSPIEKLGLSQGSLFVSAAPHFPTHTRGCVFGGRARQARHPPEPRGISRCCAAEPWLSLRTPPRHLDSLRLSKRRAVLAAVGRGAPEGERPRPSPAQGQAWAPRGSRPSPAQGQACGRLEAQAQPSPGPRAGARSWQLELRHHGAVSDRAGLLSWVTCAGAIARRP